MTLELRGRRGGGIVTFSKKDQEDSQVQVTVLLFLFVKNGSEPKCIQVSKKTTVVACSFQLALAEHSSSASHSDSRRARLLWHQREIFRIKVSEGRTGTSLEEILSGSLIKG